MGSWAWCAVTSSARHGAQDLRRRAVSFLRRRAATTASSPSSVAPVHDRACGNPAKPAWMRMAVNDSNLPGNRNLFAPVGALVGAVVHPCGHSGRAWARPTHWSRRLSRVDRRPVTRLGDRSSGLARCGEPRVLRLRHLGERFLWSRAERRARLEIGDVGDVAAVLVAVEDVDVVVAQRSSSRVRA